MKKLMFLAGIAAATIASANVCVTGKDECGETVQGAGTAHKVVITLKTTNQKSTSSKKACEDAKCTYYRVQATKKINGLIWSQLDACDGCQLLGEKSAFWTATEAIDAEFMIGLGLIGKSTKSKQIEACGSLIGDEFGSLSWAGFGSLTVKPPRKVKGNCTEECYDCSAWVKSISGGIAGALVVPEYTVPCGECLPIEYEDCCGDIHLSSAAAYGTIKISYDAATAKKVALAADADDIASFVKLPAKVASNIVVNDVIIEE